MLMVDTANTVLRYVGHWWRERVWVALVAAWLLLVSGGLGALARYKSSAGAEGAAPAAWPVDSGVTREEGKATLVLLAHPHCPCTRASLAELESIMARAGPRIAAHVFFILPTDADASWLDSELWRRAGRIPGVTRTWDEDGRVARLFGAKTSGDAALYDVAGRLRYHGGITSARGHVGDNLGESAIVSLALRGTAPLDQAPVYGCALGQP